MKLLAFDLETHLIQPGLLAPPIVCGSFAFESGSTALLNREDTLLSVAHWLDEPDIAWVGANIAYDFGCVLAVRPDLFDAVWRAYEEKRVWDVQIASSLHAIAEGRMRDGELFRPDGSKIMSGRYSLDECVREWLGRTDAKRNDEYRLRYAELENLPIEQWPEVARQYPIDDARNTLAVAEAQTKALNKGDHAAQVHAAFCIHLGAVWGLRTDPERVEQFRATVAEHLEGLRQFALQHSLMRLKKDGSMSKDTAVIKELVLKAYGGNAPKTAGGGVSISRETLEDSGDPILEKFAEVGKWEKFQTYVPTLVEASQKPLNVKPNVLLSTGRVSYEGLIQLMPRKGGVRECFVARPGTVWSSVDYAAIEMSTLAQVCIWTVGWSELADAINADKDPHCILGADLLGIDYGEFLRRKSELKEIRQAGKAGNFGYPGMMGAVKFVVAQKKAGYSVCEWLANDGKCGGEKVMEWNGTPLEGPLCKRCIEQAEVIRQRYLGRWTEVPKYWRWVMSEIETNDSITQFVSGRVRGSPHGPAAANSLFQGLAADGAKRAVTQLTKEMYLDTASPLYGSRLVLFAHDETIIEIPEEKAHDAAMRQAQVMVEKMRECVPDVKVKAEPALMRRWYKQAEAVYENGKLVPWEVK